MNENQERKAFEAWVLEGDKDAALDLHFMECGRYAINRIQWAWSAWQARAALAAYEQAQAEPWQPIETAPMDGRHALVYRPLAAKTHDQEVTIKRLIGGQHPYWNQTVPKGQEGCNPTDGACHVTHWMPLPPHPPASQGEQA